MKDNFNRTIDYVRIGVTDRCNLRCFYCMPKQGIVYDAKDELLTFEEILRILKLLSSIGFRKVRFTGGEPFLRKGFIDLVERTHLLNTYSDIRITTNGTFIERYIAKLKALNINTINFSLDSLDEKRFNFITRRNDFKKVLGGLHLLIKEGFFVKVNAVIMNDINTEDILPMVELAKHQKVSVRFIEEMPFNGGYKKNTSIFTAKDIYNKILNAHPSLVALHSKHGDTSTNYKIDNFVGNVGIIPAFSRTFCNTCNRLRITPKGDIKTCLYDGGVFNIKDFMRAGASDEQLTDKFIELIKQKPKDGFVAERSNAANLIGKESMSTIGG